MAYSQQAKTRCVDVQIGSLESIRERALGMSQLLTELQSDISPEAYEAIARHLEGIESAACSQLDMLIARAAAAAEGSNLSRKAE